MGLERSTVEIGTNEEKMYEEKGWDPPTKRGKRKSERRGEDKTGIVRQTSRRPLYSAAEMYVVVSIYTIRGEPSGTVIIVRTCGDESVFEFKNKIENRAWPPTHVDCISHDSVTMETHRSLDEYGIRHGSTIVCMPFFSMEQLAEARGLTPSKRYK